MSQTLSTVDLIALAQAVKLAECNDEAALPPETSAPVDFTVHVSGEVVRGKSATRAGTNRARSVPVICLMLHELGCTRSHTPGHIIELWSRLAGLSKKAMAEKAAALTAEEQSRYETMLALFDSEIVDNLPRIAQKGGVKFHGTVKKV